jgi:hypothetical protein
MNESDLKSKLIEKLVPMVIPWRVFRHEDRLTAGIPDMSVNGNSRTSWWEVKFVTDERPKISGVRLQLERMRQLEVESFAANYIIFELYDNSKRTLIVGPRFVEYGERTDRLSLHSEIAVGFDFVFIAEFIRKVHRS